MSRFLNGSSTSVVLHNKMLSFLPKYAPLPRGIFHYSDPGYCILGNIVEELYGGGDLNDILWRELLAPLGVAINSTDGYMRYKTSEPTLDRAPFGSDRFNRLSHRIQYDELLPGRWYDFTMTDTKTFPANYIVSSEDGSSDWASGGLIISAPTLAKFWQSIMQGTHPNPRISSAVRDMLLDSVKGEHYINCDCVGDECCDRIPDDEYGCWSYGFGVYKWLVKDRSMRTESASLLWGIPGTAAALAFGRQARASHSLAPTTRTLMGGTSSSCSFRTHQGWRAAWSTEKQRVRYIIRVVLRYCCHRVF